MFKIKTVSEECHLNVMRNALHALGLNPKFGSPDNPGLCIGRCFDFLVWSEESGWGFNMGIGDYAGMDVYTNVYGIVTHVLPHLIYGTFV